MYSRWALLPRLAPSRPRPCLKGLADRSEQANSHVRAALHMADVRRAELLARGTLRDELEVMRFFERAPIRRE